MKKINFLEVDKHFSNGIFSRDHESVEIMLRRFKREVANSGVLSELKRREFFEKPSVARKKAKEAASRRKFRRKIFYNID